MPKLQCALYAAVMVASVALNASGALAADAAHAWGTVSNPGSVFLNSAATHLQEGEAAQAISQGAGGGVTTTGGFPAVTSCGTCTTITIQGNQDSISGNSISSVNQGTVTSNGFFNQ